MKLNRRSLILSLPAGILVALFGRDAFVWDMNTGKPVCTTKRLSEIVMETMKRRAKDFESNVAGSNALFERLRRR